jgi:hypothetical protein
MNEERTVVRDAPVASVWDLNDEELDRVLPPRFTGSSPVTSSACVAPRPK